MSDRFNCAVHGLQLVDNYNDGCQWCRWAEEDAARDRDEMKKSLSEIARTMTNLGDYACPLLHADLAQGWSLTLSTLSW